MQSFSIQEFIFIYNQLFVWQPCKKHTFFWVALIYLLALLQMIEFIVEFNTAIT